MRLLKYKQSLEVKGDYILSSWSEYAKVMDYIKYPTLDGNPIRVVLWCWTMTDIRELLKCGEYKSCEYTAVLKQDTLSTLLAEFPEFREKEKSSWEVYQEFLKSYHRILKPEVVNALYNRTKGKIDAIKEALEQLDAMFPRSVTLTLKEVDLVLVAKKEVYARDVVLALLLCNNPIIPLRGHRYSKYRTMNIFSKLTMLEDTIGRSYAFYAMRKFLQKLDEDKQRYLKGEATKDIKDKFILEHIDTYSLLTARFIFESVDWKAARCAIHMILERGNNNDIITGTILNPSYWSNDTVS